MALVPYDQLLILPPETTLADALEEAHRRRQPVFGVEEGRELYLVWAAELMDLAFEVAEGDVTRQCQLLASLFRSDRPVLVALRQARLLPAPVPARGEFELRALAVAGDLEAGEPSTEARDGVEVESARTFGWGVPHSDAFFCRYVCESRQHQWPCAKANRPERCPTRKPWRKELVR